MDPVSGGKEADGMRNKWIKLLLVSAAMLLLSGCLFRPPDDLYKLPEKSPGYEQLNSAIRAVRSQLEMKYGTSSELAVIVSGDNTASIQLIPTTVATALMRMQAITSRNRYL